MKLKDLLYDSLDGDKKYSHMTREQLMNMEISLIEIEDYIPVVGSDYNPVTNTLHLFL